MATIAQFAVRMALAGALMLAGCRHEPTGEIRANGTLEVIEVDISPMQSGRVTKMWTDEGAWVHAGDTLVSLTTSTMLPDIDAQRARVASAAAQLRDLQAGARPAELEQLSADLRAAESEATRAAHDLQRGVPLAANGTISQQQLDALRGAATSTEARRDAARQALTLAQEGTRPARVLAAQAELASARATLAAAEGRASDLVLTSPLTGRVMQRSAQPGEMLAAGTIALTLGDVTQPYVRVYVDQRALPRIALGSPAVATLDAFPSRPFTGRVVALSDKAEYTPRVALTEEERADLLFGVKVQFSDTTGMLKAGLPVTVRFSGLPPAGDTLDRASRVRISGP